MMRYKKPWPLERLKDAGYSQHKLLRDHILGSATVTRLRHGKPAAWSVIELICRLTDCQPGDLLEFVPDADHAE